jgi:ATP-binding cassette subfamily A (ABC1) protein 3
VCHDDITHPHIRFFLVSEFGPIIVVLGLLYPVAAMISYITREKELRQKELMKMMSVSESDINWAWFVSFFWFHVITALGAAGVSASLYERSSFILLFIFWLLTLTSVIVFCMTIAALTAKAVRAVLIGLLVFFTGVFLTLAVSYQTGSKGTIALISLHPVAAFSYGLQEIGHLEDQGVGVISSAIGSTDNPSGYTFSNTLGNLFLDCIVWGFLTFYLNRVIPPAYGQALPLYFPFQYSYWFPGRAQAPTADDDEDEIPADGIPFEPVSDTLKKQKKEGKSIEIRNLRKVFGREKVAIGDLSLSMYQGQITALLGHNGAGKTTTISCLTGALKPTSGYATVAGKDTRTQMHQIRQDIGICLQHDCLFPLLTVREHVQFFARVKGLYAKTSRADAERQVDQAIQDVALSEKRNTPSKNLSGGMKRKLSVAIAFCGGSKVVLLDEPTSGMDPFSRRFTWNVIRQYRQDRCIILTTHFMDEADILGDRIAIMADGELRCAGSSLFLKKTYGVGYQLTIEKQNEVDEATRGDDGPLGKTTPSLNEDDDMKPEKAVESQDERLKSIVLGAVPNASLLSNVGNELSYQLPMGDASNFAPMFEDLDTLFEQKTISSYGVSMTTLDEVFLLVARGGSENKDSMASSLLKTSGEDALAVDPDKSVRSRMDLENDGLFTRHVAALLKKRAASFQRDRKAWWYVGVFSTRCISNEQCST